MATMKHRALVGMLMTLGMALGTAACGPDVPANPDWAVDVQPIIQARCVRCHATPAPGMPPRIDPTYNKMGAFAFDTGAAPAPALAAFMLNRVRGTPGMVIMPPPPAAPLESWQIDILANYVKNHP